MNEVRYCLGPQAGRSSGPTKGKGKQDQKEQEWELRFEILSRGTHYHNYRIEGIGYISRFHPLHPHYREDNPNRNLASPPSSAAPSSTTPTSPRAGYPTVFRRPAAAAGAGSRYTEDSEEPDPEYEEELESEEMEEDEEATDGGDLGTIAEEADPGPENVEEEADTTPPPSSTVPPGSTTLPTTGASGLTFPSDQVVVTADYLDYAPTSSAALDPVMLDPTASTSSTVAHGTTAAAPAADDEADDAAATLPRPTDNPAGDGDEDEGPWDV
eukprot:s158_g31.t1